jgi:hypothetical protein
MTSLSSPTSEVDLVLQKSILAQAHKKCPARNGLRVPCRAEKSFIANRRTTIQRCAGELYGQ